jgi:predicted permease
LRQDRRTGTGGAKARAIRSSLVVGQVALAFVLVVGAGLLFATVRNLLNVDPGFSRENVITAIVNPDGGRYRQDADVRRLVDPLIERVRSIPGVVSAGATTLIPLHGGYGSAQGIFVEGYTQPGNEPMVAPQWAQITPGFFETLQTPLIRGRDFDESDDASAPGVVIVDERLANRVWPGADPLGKRVFQPAVSGNAAVPTENTRWLTVVGVVPEVRFESLAGNAAAAGAYYTPQKQSSHRYYTLAVRSRADTASVVRAIRAELAALDPELALFNVQTMTERANQSLARERLGMTLALAFGAIALFLSTLGIYGVLAYLVAQRSHEIGVRIALGSTVRQIFGLVLREGAVLVASGLVLGVAGIALLGRAMAGLVYGVSPTDPVLILLVAVLLAGTALAAAAVPARRATKVDPIVVLNAQ